MMLEPASYRRHRFPAEIISHAVWLYHVFSLSLRDVELILAERGVVVSHESIRHWCLKFGADFARRLRRRRPQPGETWHLDEVFVRIAISWLRPGIGALGPKRSGSGDRRPASISQCEILISHRSTAHVSAFINLPMPAAALAKKVPTNLRSALELGKGHLRDIEPRQKPE
jgi:putative transposase